MAAFESDYFIELAQRPARAEEAMKIVHVTDSVRPRDGATDCAVEVLARQQRSQGHDVRIVTLTPAQPDSNRDVDDVAVTRPTVSRARALVSARGLRAIAGACITPDLDVVHAHFAVSSPLAITAARVANRRGIPLAVTVHALWPSKPVLRAANLVHWHTPVRGAWSAVSTVSATSVRRCLERDTDVLVVPDFVDPVWWTRGAATAPHNELRLVTVAGNGTARLLDVLAAERGSGAAIRLSVIGNRKGLHDQIAKLGLQNSVNVHSPTELREILHAADVYVAPARKCAFDTSALQARTSGLPVIGFRDAGLSDFIAGDREGVLVTNDAELTDILTSLSRNRGELDRWRAITTNRRPSVTGADTLRAVEELYDRARRSTGMRTPTTVRPSRPTANKIFLPRGLPQAPTAASVRSCSAPSVASRT